MINNIKSDGKDNCVTDSFFSIVFFFPLMAFIDEGKCLPPSPSPLPGDPVYLHLFSLCLGAWGVGRGG